MTGKTHFIMGVATGALMIRHGFVDANIMIPLVSGIGAYFPDIDKDGTTINNFLHMKKIYYVVVGMILLYFNRDAGTMILAAALIWIGLTKHRGITHSFFALVFVMAITYPYTDLDKALISGYASHLLGDSLTERSLELLYPLSSWKPIFRFNSSFIEAVAFVMSIGAIAGLDRIAAVLNLIGAY